MCSSKAINSVVMLPRRLDKKTIRQGQAEISLSLAPTNKKRRNLQTQANTIQKINSEEGATHRLYNEDGCLHGFLESFEAHIAHHCANTLRCERAQQPFCFGLVFL